MNHAPQKINKNIDLKIKKYGLTSGQSALWFLHKLSPENPIYNICRAVEINYNLNLKLFKKSLEILIQKHEALRTIFVYETDTPYQIVTEKINLDFKIVDAEGKNDEFIDESLYKDSIVPFDLENGPLFRVSVIKITNHKYIVLFCFHHIIADLWSLAILINEGGIIYDALLKNEEPNLHFSNYKFSNRVSEENEFLKSKQAGNMLEFWRSQLEGELPVLTIPKKFIENDRNAYLGASTAINLGKTKTSKLKEFSILNKTTIFSILLSTFHVLLYRYTGQDDIIIGTTKAGRKRSSIFTVGYFVNSIPIRAKINGDQPYLEFLNNEHKNILEVSKNDKYPFGLLVEKLQPLREMDKTPIFQTFFTMQKTTKMVKGDGLAYLSIGESGGFMNWGPIPIVSKGLKKKIIPFDLTMLVAETYDDLLISFQYCKDLYSDEFIVEMLKSYDFLLNDIVKNPNKKIKNLDLLYAQNEQISNQILKKTINSDQPFISIIEKFEDNVKSFPNALALINQDQQFTYFELNQLANQISKKLGKFGIKPEKTVGVYLKRTPNIIISLLAIWKAGGIYIPIDSSNPLERVEYIIKDANIDLLVVDKEIQFPNLNKQLVQFNINNEIDLNSSIIFENSSIQISEVNNAYIIYTSGSTGFPKGVRISHKNINSHISAVKLTFGITKDDKVLQFASIGFDASIEQILETFINGGVLYLRGEELWSPSEFIKLIQSQELTVVNIPPAYWTQFTKELNRLNFDKERLKLRLIIVGGDIIPFDVLKIWQSSELKNIQVINAYGPTETTITSTFYNIPFNFSSESRLNKVPIGKVLRNKNLYILDKFLNPLPNGVQGEIFIGGSTISSGYVNKPDFTAECFIPDPFSKVPGARLYRTGDLAKYLPNGKIDFVGRIDNQIKVRGMRIEIEEIENVIQKHPDISRVAININENGSGDKVLSGYYVSKSGKKIDFSEFKEFLINKIPNYMIPSIFIQLKEMPVSVIGKIERKSLPKPDFSQNITSPYVAPRSFIEKEITQIIAKILNKEKIGILDDFFELGGHSILAIQIISKINKEFGINIPLGHFFEYPNVASLSQEVTKLIATSIEEGNLEYLLNT